MNAIRSAITGGVMLGAAGLVGALAPTVFRHLQSLAPEQFASLETTAAACDGQLEPVSGNACFVSPHDHANAPLLVYSPGAFRPEAAKEEAARRERVVRMAVARGFAVLVVKGELGDCNHPSPTSTCLQVALDDAKERTQTIGNPGGVTITNGTMPLTPPSDEPAE
jgi:hypothetical protein